MRADWTASGACTSGSTAPPRGATRRASGGAATTSTTSAERRRGCRGATAGREISRSMVSQRAFFGVSAVLCFPKIDSIGRSSRAVDFMSDASPKFIAIDEEPDYQIVHGRRFGKANDATHESLDPGLQMDMFALDGLHVRFTDCMLRRIKMPLVGAPPIGVKSRDSKRL